MEILVGVLAVAVVVLVVVVAVMVNRRELPRLWTIG